MVGIDIPNNRGENLVHISAQANNQNMLLSICQMGEKHNLTTAINSRFYKKKSFSDYLRYGSTYAQGSNPRCIF